MRAIICLLLCALSAYAFAAMPGIGGTWVFYGNRSGGVRIDEQSAILEDETGLRYLLREEQGNDGRRFVAGKDGAHSGDIRKIVRVHENVLLFSGVKNPILVREGTRFAAPREKIRGRWHYAEQLNETFYYDAEFDLDAGNMVEILRSENGKLVRSEARSFETLLDAQTELALRLNGTVYHFARLGADFLVLEPSYGESGRNGYKILMERTRMPSAVKQPKTHYAKRDRGAVTKQQTDAIRKINKNKGQKPKKQAIKKKKRQSGA